VFGGILCILFSARYCLKSDESLKLVRLGDHEATVLNTCVEEDQEDKAKEGDKLDYDITLIVITFVISSVYFASEVFIAFSLSEYVTMVYWLLAPLAPLGLSILAATVWRKPAVTSQSSLFIALLPASWWILSIEVAEDCHLDAVTIPCCSTAIIT
jgi:hypothetical protein